MADTDVSHTNDKNQSFDFEDFIKTEISLVNNSDSTGALDSELGQNELWKLNEIYHTNRHGSKTLLKFYEHKNKR